LAGVSSPDTLDVSAWSSLYDSSRVQIVWPFTSLHHTIGSGLHAVESVVEQGASVARVIMAPPRKTMIAMVALAVIDTTISIARRLIVLPTPEGA
jgi:hypothetical protein